MTINNIHFVGSIGLENSDQVFRSLGSIIGERASRYPDGETGNRHYWVQWQSAVFENHEAFEFETEREQLTDTANRTSLFALKNPGAVEELEFDEIGYASEALASYAQFKQIKQEGVIPESTRFQVSLPTPIAVLTTFLVPDHRPLAEAAYTKAMVSELQAILAGIPHDELAIQWDVAHEVVCYEGNFPFAYSDILEGTGDRVSYLLKLIPASVITGAHLCYGDPGHKHIIDPVDLGNCVKFANLIYNQSEGRLDFVHMPVLIERKDNDYFSPLTDLAIGSAELVLGLVHYTDGADGTRERINTAKKFVSDFSIATECGFGRRDPETIPDLLAIHRDVFDSK